MVAGAVALAVVLVLVSGVGQENPPDETLEFSAATPETSPSTTIPLDTGAPATVNFAMADLLRGPRFGWSELVLPEALTAVFAVGEFRGSPALIGSNEPLDAYGRTPGAVAYVLKPIGWAEPVAVFGPERFATAADIGPRGFVVTSNETGSAQRMSSTATDTRVHSSVSGLFWSETAVQRDGTSATVIGIGSDPSSTFVLLSFEPNATAAVASALPDEIRVLLDDPLTYLNVDGDGQVSVLFAATFIPYSTTDPALYETTLDILGVEFDPTAAQFVSGQPGLWVSRDSLTFAESPIPEGGLFLAKGLGSSPGVGVYLDGTEGGSQTLLRWVDGSDWEVVEGPSAGPIVVVNSHGGTAVAGLGPVEPGLSIDSFGGDAGRRTVFDLGINGKIVGEAAVGQAGYLLPVGGVVGVPVEPEPVIVEQGDLTLTIDAGRIEIEDGLGRVTSLVSAYPFGAFDLATRSLEVLGPDGTVLGSIPIEVLGASYAVSESTTNQTTGVLFTPDGEQWGWSPLVDLLGENPGRVAAAAVGQTDVYVIAGRPPGPLGFGSTEPRLFVGRRIG